MKQETKHQQVGRALDEGWLRGGSLFGSLLAGTLLGYFADKWLGTEPWLVIVGIVLGSYAGFMKLWHYSKQMDDDARRG
jgi:ATP synthase protein I